ncbi:MAG: pilus assembly protein, partial [Chloroflexi bacterium]|nr:pilus assembly protein [Chloroflexota bacterium]
MHKLEPVKYLKHMFLKPVERRFIAVRLSSRRSLHGLRQRTSRLVKGEKGVVAILVALLLPAIFGMVALTTDLGIAFSTRRQLQNASDAAALAGARDMALSLGQATAIASATNYVNSNISGAEITGIDIDEVAREITVSTRRNDPAVFARVFGINLMNITATATAHWYHPDYVLNKLCPIGIEASVFQLAYDNDNPNYDSDGDGIYDVTLVDIQIGTQPGNWGWLDWNGPPLSADTLAEWLGPPCTMPPGETVWGEDSDHPEWSLEPGDTGVKNNVWIRKALDDWIDSGESMPIVVWQVSEKQGGNTTYEILRFAAFRLVGYNLPQGRIWGYYVEGEWDDTWVVGGGDSGNDYG